MIPSAAEIVTARWRMTAWVRILGAAAMFVAVPALISWFGEGLQDDDLWDYSYYAGRMITGLGGIVIGLILFVLAPVLVRLLLPAPAATECPRCRYALAGAGGAHCPECGLQVGAEYIAGATGEPDRRHRRLGRLLDDIGPAVALLGCAWGAVLGLLALVALAIDLGIAGVAIWIVVIGPVAPALALCLRLASSASRAARDAPPAPAAICPACAAALSGAEANCPGCGRVLTPPVTPPVTPPHAGP